MDNDTQRPEGTDTPVADAYAQNWVDRHAPPLRALSALSRIDRPIGTWLLLLPCWWGAFLGAAAPDRAGWLTVWIVVACGIGAVLMRGAGCTWNDVTDRDIDDKVARTRSRPIPSGQVTTRQALIWMGVQTGVAALDPVHLQLGGCRAWGAVAGAGGDLPVCQALHMVAADISGAGVQLGRGAGLDGANRQPGLPAIFLYLAGISWTLFYDTIYAHQDREDDALIGVKSTARLFGDDTDKWLRGFLVATVVSDVAGRHLRAGAVGQPAWPCPSGWRAPGRWGGTCNGS